MMKSTQNIVCMLKYRCLEMLFFALCFFTAKGNNEFSTRAEEGVNEVVARCDLKLNDKTLKEIYKRNVVGNTLRLEVDVENPIYSGGLLPRRNTQLVFKPFPENPYHILSAEGDTIKLLEPEIATETFHDVHVNRLYVDLDGYEVWEVDLKEEIKSFLQIHHVSKIQFKKKKHYPALCHFDLKEINRKLPQELPSKKGKHNGELRAPNNTNKETLFLIPAVSISAKTVLIEPAVRSIEFTYFSTPKVTAFKLSNKEDLNCHTEEKKDVLEKKLEYNVIKKLEYKVIHNITILRVDEKLKKIFGGLLKTETMLHFRTIRKDVEKGLIACTLYIYTSHSYCHRNSKGDVYIQKIKGEDGEDVGFNIKTIFSKKTKIKSKHLTCEDKKKGYRIKYYHSKLMGGTCNDVTIYKYPANIEPLTNVLVYKNEKNEIIEYFWPVHVDVPVSPWVRDDKKLMKTENNVVIQEKENNIIFLQYLAKEQSLTGTKRIVHAFETDRKSVWLMADKVNEATWNAEDRKKLDAKPVIIKPRRCRSRGWYDFKPEDIKLGISKFDFNLEHPEDVQIKN